MGRPEACSSSGTTGNEGPGACVQPQRLAKHATSSIDLVDFTIWVEDETPAPPQVQAQGIRPWSSMESQTRTLIRQRLFSPMLHTPNIQDRVSSRDLKKSDPARHDRCMANTASPPRRNGSEPSVHEKIAVLLSRTGSHHFGEEDRGDQKQGDHAYGVEV
jgi:hypothetical protein